MPLCPQQVQNAQVAREDQVFWMFDVLVLHGLSMAGQRGEIKRSCATMPTAYRQRRGLVIPDSLQTTENSFEKHTLRPFRTRKVMHSGVT